MRFGEFALAESEGLLLAHSIPLPGGRLRKGQRISKLSIEVLGAAGVTRVTGARLDTDDLDENVAAGLVAACLSGKGITAHAPNAGRCNLFATERGLVTFDAQVIDAINAHDESIAVATLPPFSVVRPGSVVATVKVMPLAVRRTLVEACVATVRERPAILLQKFTPRRGALIVTEQPGESPSNYFAAVNSSRARFEGLGSRLGLVLRCQHRTSDIRAMLIEAYAAGCTLILISGAMVTKDRVDIVPSAVVAAGGEIVHFGMPVEPGNMLVMARLNEVPVICMPSCARSRRSNGLDWILRRILAGLPVEAEHIMAMGVGGLIRKTDEDIGEGEAAQTRTPALQLSGSRIGALVLAAGSSSRMTQGNKLLQPVGGVAMVRRVVNAALASCCSSVDVVIGHEAEEICRCLVGRDVKFVFNPGYQSGMASSLHYGLGSLDSSVDAVVVLLGDMPLIDARHIDRLIEAFDPRLPRIVVPMNGGRCGNPILWPRAFFTELQSLNGDVGAKDLLHRYAGQVHGVEMTDAAISCDVDTLTDVANRHV